MSESLVSNMFREACRIALCEINYHANHFIQRSVSISTLTSDARVNPIICEVSIAYK